MAAGYFRGVTDLVVTTLLDAMMAIPAVLLALALVLFVGQSLDTILLIIGVLTIPAFARIARSATMAVADREFVAAARLTGARHRRLQFREIGPNIAVPLLTYVLLLAGVAMLAEGALSFVGLGVPPDKASWGRLIFAGRDELQRAWWWSLCPSGVFVLTVLSLSVVQEHLQRRWLGLDRVVRGRARLSVDPFAGEDLKTTCAVVSAVTPTDAASDAVLNVIDLHTYLSTPFGTVRAVDGVSLRVESGKMLAIVGESGAGKTMLARSILGIAPSASVVSGQVILGGVDLLTLAASELRKRRGREIAIVLQDPMTSLDPVMRVGSQISELAQVHLDMSRREAQRHAVQLLAEVGIGEPERRARQYPHELSGGLRQRVAIAMALSCGPKVLIADEPTSALDVIVQAQILDLIDRLRRERDLAVVLITHDLLLALARADEVAVMYAGRIVEQASARTLATGLRMPYASALFAAAPRLSAASHQRPVPIPGRPPSPIALTVGCSFAPRCGFATRQCATDVPVLRLLDGDRRVACWAPLEMTGRDESTHLPLGAGG